MRRVMAFAIGLAGSAFLAVGLAQSPHASFAGTWSGAAEPIVSWTNVRTLPVRLVIDSAGRVHGRVGDAELFDAELRSNRGPVTRALGWKTELIVHGRLRGAVIAAEHVVRDGVNIPLNPRDGMLVGSVHTTGDKFGGRDRMILTAARLTLRRETLSSP